MCSEKVIFNIKKCYYANKTQFVRNLYLLGIINEDKCEKWQKKNVSEMLDFLERYYGKETLEKAFKKIKECR